MALQPIHFSADRLDQFNHVALIEKGALQRISEEIRKIENETKLVIAPDIIKIVQRRLEADQGRSLISLLLFIGRFIEISDEDRQSIEKAIDLGLKNANCKSEKLELWNSIRDVFLDVVFSNVFRIATKSTDLFLEHDYHVHKLRCIVNSRPVFGMKDLASIEGFVLWSDLHLQISDGDNEQSLTVAMSKEDLELMLSEASRALEKLEKLERSFKQQGTKTRIYSEETDARV